MMRLMMMMMGIGSGDVKDVVGVRAIIVVRIYVWRGLGGTLVRCCGSCGVCDEGGEFFGKVHA